MTCTFCCYQLYWVSLQIILSSENHQTQTDYDNALILKQFAFQFVNSYTSLYYIAFFRGVSINCLSKGGR